MTTFTITFKKTARSKQVMVWERFGNSIEEATASVNIALKSEYYGEAVLLSVEAK